MEQNPFENMPVIDCYTRAQAIEDGVLVDLSDWARESGGFKSPVAVTAAVWADLHNIPARYSHCSVRGRAHDLFWMARWAVKPNGDNTIVYFRLIMPLTGTRKRLQTYKMVAGPGDAGELVITVMQPHED